MAAVSSDAYDCYLGESGWQLNSVAKRNGNKCNECNKSSTISIKFKFDADRKFLDFCNICGKRYYDLLDDNCSDEREKKIVSELLKKYF